MAYDGRAGMGVDASLWALGMVALLAMVVGWFRVRSRAKKHESPA